MNFTHLDAEQRPTMVDVSDKTATQRTAIAEAKVLFPPAVAAALRDSGLRSRKGPGVRYRHRRGRHGREAHSRTHSFLPPARDRELPHRHRSRGDSAVIRCTVSVHHKTGVEMEALTGASIAALTIYDMCKAFSHGIVIGDVRLLAKDGGKQRVLEAGYAVNLSIPPIYGLILAGGSSSRMHRDKAALKYRGSSQLDRAFELASRHVPKFLYRCAPIKRVIRCARIGP